jgi:hypothetical protein
LSVPNEGITGLVPATDGSLWVGLGLAAPGAGLQHMVNGSLQPFRAAKFNGETLEVLSMLAMSQSKLATMSSLITHLNVEALLGDATMGDTIVQLCSPLCCGLMHLD